MAKHILNFECVDNLSIGSLIVRTKLGDCIAENHSINWFDKKASRTASEILVVSDHQMAYNTIKSSKYL